MPPGPYAPHPGAAAPELGRETQPPVMHGGPPSNGAGRDPFEAWPVSADMTGPQGHTPSVPLAPVAASFKSPSVDMSFEVDEIPSAYRLRSKPRVWLWAVLGAAIAALVAAVYLLTRGAAGPDTAVPVLEIITSPEGAKVSIDGTVQPDKTPVVFRGAEPGRTYTIGFELEGYEPMTRTVEYPANMNRHQLILRLNKQTVRLRVESEPPGAAVFINAQQVGKTPIELDALDPGETKTLELRMSGYRPSLRPLEWGEGEIDKKLQIELEPSE